jgi:ATP-binding cassette, subfamily F, member 3
LGTNVETASIEQVLEHQLDFNQSPLEICGTSTMARTLLGCLKLPPDCLNRPLRSLSGGERTKVAMARVLNSSANLLLLDEPTNHLEIEAQEALEDALRSYPGTVIAVSHDRAFLRALGEDSKTIELPFAAGPAGLP